jgi:hypothetical protein
VLQNGAAIELKQLKTFKQSGSKKFSRLYDGTEIVGTEAACKAEMADVWRRIMNGEGQKMKDAVRKMKLISTRSWRDGQSRQVMEGLKQFWK